LRTAPYTVADVDRRKLRSAKLKGPRPIASPRPSPAAASLKEKKRDARQDLQIKARGPRHQTARPLLYRGRKITRAAPSESAAATYGNRTLLMSGIGEEVSFVCECGRTNKRRSALLRNRQVVGCVGFDCEESFDITIQDEEFYFGRRVIRFDCKCGENLTIPTRVTEKLRSDQFVGVQCLKCGEETRFIWRLIPTRRTDSSAAKDVS
jgi:hypothetical protein